MVSGLVERPGKREGRERGSVSGRKTESNGFEFRTTISIIYLFTAEHNNPSMSILLKYGIIFIELRVRNYNVAIMVAS